MGVEVAGHLLNGRVLQSTFLSREAAAANLLREGVGELQLLDTFSMAGCCPFVDRGGDVADLS